MQKNVPKLLTVIFTAAVFALLSSCGGDDEDRPVFPLTDGSTVLFHSVSGKQVAFNALTHSATSWTWDFGDGETSTEQNPVHVYEEGGYYVATLTVKDNRGTTVTKSVKLALDLPPYALLTGDHTAEGYKGKTWKLTASHSGAGDYLANANANLTTFSGTPRPLPDGIFNTEFGMGDIYQDTYTFYEDGKYEMDLKADEAVFSGLVYQMVPPRAGASGIVNNNGQTYGLCIAKYAPDANATFTFNDGENLTVSSVHGAGGTITYNNVMTLDFSGTAFLGFRDFQRKVIVRSISDTRMQVVMFMAAGTSPVQIIGVNTNALILTFEVVQ